MRIARVRRIFVPVAIVLATGAAVLLGCSSDSNPPSADDGSNNGGAPVDSGPSSILDTGATTNDDGSTPASDGSIVDTGAVSDGPVETQAAFTCLNDSPAPDGANLPTTCPASAGCSAYCSKIGANFKHGVAQTIVECIDKSSSCDIFVATNCITSTSERVCADTSSNTQCTTMVAGCTGIQAADQAQSVTDCVNAMAELSAAGQSIYTGCVQSATTGGTCSGDTFLGCLDDTYR